MLNIVTAVTCCLTNEEDNSYHLHEPHARIDRNAGMRVYRVVDEM